MSFLGQLNFGYPITSHNIIKTAPNNAVLPLSIGSSLQGNILGITVADFASSLNPSSYDDEGNTFIGLNSNPNHLTNVNNTSVGKESLFSNGGANNVAIGIQALYFNTYGGQNVAIGNESLLKNTMGGANVAIGNATLANNITGNGNTAVGVNSLSSATASGNTALGNDAGYVISTGANNLVLGQQAGNNLRTGNGNVLIGYLAGSFLINGSDNTVIGSNTILNDFSGSTVIGNGATADGNNQFVVGSTSHNAGTVTTETVSSTKTWTVKINGVNRKILLA